MKYKKAISPVVATALLLVVAVVSVVGFQGWFQTFSSNLFVSTESESSIDNLAEIETLVGNSLYINAGNNLTIKSIKINNIDCIIQGNYSGMEEINISSCINETSGSKKEIVITTNKNVLTKFIFVGDSDSSNSVSELSAPSCSTSGANGFANGDGTSGTPYQICNCFQLQNMSINLTASYELISDIDCSDTYNWNNNGSHYNGFSSIGVDSGTFFDGVFIGNYYTIDSLYQYNSADEGSGGLFGFVNSGGVIENVTLTNINFTKLPGFLDSKAPVGGLVGATNMVNSINNVVTSGIVTGDNGVGGVVGSYYCGSHSNLTSTATVIGVEDFGQVIGIDTCS